MCALVSRWVRNMLDSSMTISYIFFLGTGHLSYISRTKSLFQNVISQPSSHFTCQKILSLDSFELWMGFVHTFIKQPSHSLNKSNFAKCEYYMILIKIRLGIARRYFRKYLCGILLNSALFDSLLITIPTHSILPMFSSHNKKNLSL